MVEYCDVNETSRLTCGHVFHSTCISNWLNKHETCPNCRTCVQSIKKTSSKPSDRLVELRDLFSFKPSARRYPTSGYIEILPSQDDIMYDSEVESRVIGNTLMNGEWMMVWQYEYYDIYARYVNLLFWKHHQEYHELYDDEYMIEYERLQQEMQPFNERKRASLTGYSALMDIVMHNREQLTRPLFNPLFV